MIEPISKCLQNDDCSRYNTLLSALTHCTMYVGLTLTFHRAMQYSIIYFGRILFLLSMFRWMQLIYVVNIWRTHFADFKQWFTDVTITNGFSFSTSDVTIAKMIQKIFHNLKVLRTIAILHKFDVNSPATLSSNRWNTHFQLRLISTTKQSIECWQCGSSHSSNDGIQFQCVKCQSLLYVPNKVVRNMLYTNFGQQLNNV